MLSVIKENLEQILKLRSLRTRIFFLILVVGIIPSILLRYGIMDNYEDRAVELRSTTVQNQLTILANHLASKNYLENKRSADQCDQGGHQCRAGDAFQSV